MQRKLALISSLFIFASHELFASGLSIPLESVAALGEQRSGGAASADDATTNFFNAAGLIRVKREQLVISATGVSGQEHFVGTMSNPGLTQFGNGFITETGSTSTNIFSVVPSLHYVYPLSAQWAFGVSILTPYALSSNYPNDSLIRYDVIKSSQKSIDLSPSVAYEVTPTFSVGIGFDLLYLQAYGKVAERTQPLTTQDSIMTTDLNKVAPGWHMGLLYQATPATRVGLSYRSPIIVHLKGNGELTVPDGLYAGTNSSNNVRAKLPLGSLTTLSIYHDVTNRWAVMGSVEYEGWSTYQYDNTYSLPQIGGGTTDVVARRGLRNTWFVSFGTRYQLTDCILLRGGVSYWQGASNPQTGDVTIVDPNSTGVSVGLRYQFSPKLIFDVAAGHVFSKPLNLNYTSANSGNTVIGRSTESANLLGGQLTWNIT